MYVAHITFTQPDPAGENVNIWRDQKEFSNFLELKSYIEYQEICGRTFHEMQMETEENFQRKLRCE